MTENQKLHPLRMDEWAAIQKKAKSLWEKTHLGTRPTFDEVKKTRAKTHAISMLEWAAVAVLVVLTIFTSYKVGALAVPFAEKTLVILGDHAEISEFIKVSFTIVTMLLFALLATPSVIYFKLLAHEPEIQSEKKATEHYTFRQKISLEWVTPRLPTVVVYGTVIWLFVISNDLPGSIFEKFLPVIVEVALATLVGNILDKRTEDNKLIYAALKEKTDPYDQRLRNYEKDGQYLKTLYQTMREGLMSITRNDPKTRRSYKVNAWIEEADEATVYRLLSAEYQRLNSGERFANDQTNPGSLPVGNQTPVVAEAAPVSIETRRVPPNGELKWTVETLVQDLRLREVGNTYTEMELLKDYAPGHDARKAWRDGAKKSFLG